MNNLKKLRTEYQKRVVDLASTLNISRKHYYDLEKGERRLHADHIKKCMEIYNVTSDVILGSQASSQEQLFTPREERDLARDLERMILDLEEHEGLAYYDGQPMDEESKELLRISLEHSMRLAKQLAKKKFTPKKYKK